ncbi:hypothetical protein L211DRAFT_878378 [Terfezia boudieri ATCC MYA-4762]|uniref:PAS domain-containing protein n=1 Tax=Terfezia boudieri ATCC MYA-4762 TaxID=1051890 RepID=A0A3N4LP03_9PEZI|nr:hypothetical protein L211DRAFT_878378 [Terfezia boudieri ATCC MYA-4762]
MDITFISMHDLSPEARLVYASDSISDVLGYEPHEVVGKSLFSYFHPEEMPFAQTFHGRGVEMDKAAVLAYCRLKSKAGNYICCEIVFTVVYSVVVAATSVYRQTNKSHERALKAPYIRRAFSSSPRDPRYHMLAHLSPKFSTPQAGQHEPRACLILNRFTRTLTILYATNILMDILDFPPHQAVGMSFFEFISPGCLQDAVEALERAKENDSIAYLRFFARDPRIADVELDVRHGPHRRRQRRSGSPRSRRGRSNPDRHARESTSTQEPKPEDADTNSYSIMTSDEEEEEGDDGDHPGEGEEDNDHYYSSSHSTSGTSLSNSILPASRGPEVEAVVSCTSDGLVVVLRRARPMIPFSDPRMGFFASPWARLPYHPPNQAVGNGPGGPAAADFMDSIRQVAVFAWCLRGINEDMVQFARFEPDGSEPVLTPPRDQEHHDGAGVSELESGLAGRIDQSIVNEPVGGQSHMDSVTDYDTAQHQQRAAHKRKRSD